MTVAIGLLQANEPISPKVIGDTQMVLCELDLTGVYKTGGDASLLPLLESLFKQVGLGVVEWVMVSGIPGYVFMWNSETNKLQVFEGAAGLLKELAEAEYPAAIRTGDARMFALGS